MVTHLDNLTGTSEDEALFGNDEVAKPRDGAEKDRLSTRCAQGQKSHKDEGHGPFPLTAGMYNFFRYSRSIRRVQNRGATVLIASFITRTKPWGTPSGPRS